MARLSALLAAFLALLAVSTAVGGEGRKAMSVQVKQGQVRATPSFLGKIVATLSYGDRVEALEDKNGWMKIVPPGNKAPGWMHASALTEKKIVFKAGSKEAETGASGGELALAGKGFNADVEAEFKSKHKDIDFTWIDRMEEIKAPPGKISAFLREGQLTPVQGGGK